MNQIICTHNSHVKEEKFFDKRSNYKQKRFFKIQFFILSIISFSVLIYYMYFRYDLYNSERVSKSILDSIELSKIYGNYNTKNLNKEIVFYENGSFSVIGRIDIKSIEISYPIVSDINKEHLKISPCRFYGPMPNEVR